MEDLKDYLQKKSKDDYVWIVVNWDKFDYNNIIKELASKLEDMSLAVSMSLLTSLEKDYNDILTKRKIKIDNEVQKTLLSRGYLRLKSQQAKDKWIKDKIQHFEYLYKKPIKKNYNPEDILKIVKEFNISVQDIDKFHFGSRIYNRWTQTGDYNKFAKDIVNSFPDRLKEFSDKIHGLYIYSNIKNGYIQKNQTFYLDFIMDEDLEKNLRAERNDYEKGVLKFYQKLSYKGD